jgi:O-antigen ligase
MPLIGMTLFWADFGGGHGSYLQRLLDASLFGFLSAVLSFIVTHRLVNPLFRYLAARREDAALPLPNEELSLTAEGDSRL